MQCPKCGLPMQLLSQILIKKEGKKENTRMPTTWICQNNHYHHAKYDSLKK